MNQNQIATQKQKLLPDVFPRLGKMLGKPHLYLLGNIFAAGNPKLARQSRHWQADVGQPASDFPEISYSPGKFARWAEILAAGHPVHGRLPNFPLEERRLLAEHGLKTLAARPIFVDGQWWGFMAAVDFYDEPDWTTVELESLKTAAEILGLIIESDQQSGPMGDSRETAEVIGTGGFFNPAILDSLGEGVVLTDINGQILYVNPALEQLSGYSRTELLGHNPRIMRSGRVPKATYQELWATILRGERWSGEIVNRRKDGTLYDTVLTIAPVRAVTGEIVNFVSVQSDISRLKEVERLKSQFVSNVSHELRTPLTNITMYLTLLQKGRLERQAHYIEVLKEETDRLTRLIEDLLDLSRLDTDAKPAEPVPSNLHDSLVANYDAIKATARAKQTEILLEVDSVLPMVSIERHHLGQLLTNLLGNALAYTPEGGRITLSAGQDRDSGSLVWVQVSDTGPGISEAEKQRMFERFFRGEAAQTNGTPGTGLGLAICQEIVERYDGYIEVESELGSGACFTVWLPVAKS